MIKVKIENGENVREMEGQYFFGAVCTQLEGGDTKIASLCCGKTDLFELATSIGCAIPRFLKPVTDSPVITRLMLDVICQVIDDAKKEISDQEEAENAKEGAEDHV